MWDLGDHISGDRSWAHNNENDAILNMLREHFRRAEPTERACALEKARHNAHVDFIAFDPDPLRQGTMPAHCPEHTDGATYPSHMWVDGLMAAYCVSGEPDFLEAALAVGENMLRWQKRRPSIFYADSRECGWPFLAFLRLHEHTGERRWLDACEAIFRFYRRHVADDGRFYYELPHGVGTVRTGYGEFITWRSLFFYWERTGKPEVKRFLVTCLEKVYRLRPGVMVGGWACNDLFPAWAAFVLTGDDKYIEDNYPFLQFLMERQGGFPWGGVDMHYYLAELDRRGTLARFAGGTAAE
jgi:rhamnogalacturonyl hydrolase YesR